MVWVLEGSALAVILRVQYICVMRRYGVRPGQSQRKLSLRNADLADQPQMRAAAQTMTNNYLKSQL